MGSLHQLWSAFPWIYLLGKTKISIILSVRCPYYPKLIEIPIQLPTRFFMKLDKQILKFKWKDNIVKFWAAKKKKKSKKEKRAVPIEKSKTFPQVSPQILLPSARQKLGPMEGLYAEETGKCSYMWVHCYHKNMLQMSWKPKCKKKSFTIIRINFGWSFFTLQQGKLI